MADEKQLAAYNNQIRMKNKASDTDAEYHLFGASQVFVGVENPDEVEIVKNEDGLKYARNKIDGVEIYNLHKQDHHCWLMIDLETGSRGWYPGSKEVVDITSADIFTEPDDRSEIIQHVESVTLDKLDLVYGLSVDTPGKKIVYCKVKISNTYTGYIKNSKITNTRFVDDI